MIDDFRITKHYDKSVSLGWIETEEDVYMKSSTLRRWVETKNRGGFFFDDWQKLVEEEIYKSNLEDLLEEIKAYCRDHLSWIKTERHLHKYALYALTNQVYKAWPGFPGCRKEVCNG